MKWLTEPSSSEPEETRSDCEGRRAKRAMIYCPHCARSLAHVRTDIDHCKTYVCEGCGRHACVHVYANRFWTVSTV